MNYTSLVATITVLSCCFTAISAQQLNQRQSVKASDQASARTAYIDPVTGELTAPPATDGVTPALEQQLKQIESALPPVTFKVLNDGSMQANLNGRFHSPLMATIDCEGKVSTSHGSGELNNKAPPCSREDNDN